MDNENIIEDPTVVALCQLRGLKITPYKQDSGRIAFIVSGPVESIVEGILQNESVLIGDYLRALKAVRNAIFTLRNLKAGGR